MDLEKVFEEHKSALRQVAIEHYPIMSIDALENARGRTFEVLPADIGKALGDVLLGLAEAELDVITTDVVSKKLPTKKERMQYLMDTYKVNKQYAETVLTHSKNHAYSGHGSARK